MSTLNYFAGLMDSDGWVGHCERRLRCVISNTCATPILELKERFGGSITGTKPKKPQHKICWMWEKSDAKGTIIADLLDRSFVKRRQLGWPTDNFTMTADYVAGMFDGDGHVTVSKPSRTATRSGYEVRIDITNMDRDMLGMVVAMYGGSLQRQRTRPVTHWMASCRKAQICLEQILPHLVIKKERAELALEIARLQREGLELRRVNKNACRVLKPEVLAIADKLKRKMLALNYQGVKVA